MSKSFFSTMRPATFKGIDCDGTLTYRHYNPNKIILGKRKVISLLNGKLAAALIFQTRSIAK